MKGSNVDVPSTIMSLQNENTDMRMLLAHYYYERGMHLDAEFFAIWGGSLVVVEYKRMMELDGILNTYYDIQSMRGEIMTRTGLTKRILSPDEIYGVGIMVTEIRASSIIVNSPHFTKPKLMNV